MDVTEKVKCTCSKNFDGSLVASLKKTRNAHALRMESHVRETAGAKNARTEITCR